MSCRNFQTLQTTKMIPSSPPPSKSPSSLKRKPAFVERWMSPAVRPLLRRPSRRTASRPGPHPKHEHRLTVAARSSFTWSVTIRTTKTCMRPRPVWKRPCQSAVLVPGDLLLRDRMARLLSQLRQRSARPVSYSRNPSHRLPSNQWRSCRILRTTWKRFQSPVFLRHNRNTLQSPCNPMLLRPLRP